MTGYWLLPTAYLLMRMHLHHVPQRICSAQTAAAGDFAFERVLFVDASHDYRQGTNQNHLRDEDVRRIACQYRNGLLRDDGTVVELVIDEVNRTSIETGDVAARMSRDPGPTVDSWEE